MSQTKQQDMDESAHFSPYRPDGKLVRDVLPRSWILEAALTAQSMLDLGRRPPRAGAQAAIAAAAAMFRFHAIRWKAIFAYTTETPSRWAYDCAHTDLDVST